MVTIDISKDILRVLTDSGFGDDRTKETDISKAGMWDIMDALSGKDNSKFSKENANKEYKKRMGVFG